ncbi:RNA polymerase sigma factor [Dyadobacter sp. CY343]|uniref:RNA polymerase sigma factor n=1 Tax=Dyadobacter sp. CY343 TaxID=2907299 RepID=UPI001F3D7454|nr:sigma-70 family RNA polymerase sigma factor [Dyadobacter sp. CY343]MCE7060639.1 sigma-70 family RNA polymerase sigma factor [Dyadobacter sp. CY343]
MPSSEAMQEDLIRWKRFKGGDAAAFESIIRDEFRALFEYGTRFIHDRDTLNDCIYDLFTSLWDRRSFLADTDQIRPYLLKSLRNRLLKEKERANHLTNFEGWQEQMEPDDNAESQIITSEISAQQTRRISSVLCTLTPRQREIIHLKFFENLSNEQISDVLAISRPAVSNLLSQALKLFRDKWQATISTLFFVLTY